MRNTSAYNEQEIEILNSLGIIYCEENMCSEGISILEDALGSYNKLNYVSNEIVYIRLLYNLAKSYYLQGNLIESKKYCNQGIEHCLNIESNYLLGELLYQLGLSFMKMNKSEEALNSFNRARALFAIQNRGSYIEATDDKLRELKGTIEVL